jgi:hypothetical protein
VEGVEHPLVYLCMVTRPAVDSVWIGCGENRIYQHCGCQQEKTTACQGDTHRVFHSLSRLSYVLSKAFDQAFKLGIALDLLAYLVTRMDDSCMIAFAEAGTDIRQ